MTDTKTKWTITIPAITLFLAIALAGYLGVRQGLLTLKVAFAEEQITVFFNMRDKALMASPEEAAGCLAYAVDYYPSGTKQTSGSRLDLAVERVRRDITEQIIAHLRLKTGRDLGNAPEKWIAEYAKH